MAQASVISSKMTFWNLQRKVWDEVRISSTHTRFQDENMEKIKKVIATFYLTILIFFLAIASLYLTILREKKSELWDKKSQ